MDAWQEWFKILLGITVSICGVFFCGLCTVAGIFFTRARDDVKEAKAEIGEVRKELLSRVDQTNKIFDERLGVISGCVSQLSRDLHQMLGAEKERQKLRQGA